MAVTDASVRAIAKGIPAALDLTAYIAVAVSITGSLNSVCGASLTDAQLDLVGNYLVAHYVYLDVGSGARGNNKSQSIGKGDVSVTKNVAKLGEGIMATSFGQIANQLSQGCLVTFDQPQVGLFSIGTNALRPADVT